MADDGSALNPRDPVKSSVWDIAGLIRRQQALTVSKKRRELLIWAKRLCRVGTNVDARVENEVMIDEEQPILEAHTNVAVEELKSTVEYHHLDRKTKDNDEIEMTSSMAASSDSWRYDVFPSFRGEDVRDSFLSHLLKELKHKSITFVDDEIERSRPIGPELLSAIRGSRIALVVFSKNYASSTWCLNELVEIHECYKKLNQMVIPIFFHVDPSEVKKQTGDFGKVFEETCKGKSEDEKQSWKQALADVATMAGEDLRNWANEAAMIEKVAKDVLKKTMTPSDDFGNFVGIEAHLDALKKLMCLESEEARMVGIVGTSGIGKSTIGRAQYDQLSSQFHLRAFETCRRTIGDDYEQKLYWEEQILSKMLGEKDLKIEKVGAVKERLNEKKVLIVLDDVNDLEFLKTLVGKTEWFGPGSIIIVITQDRQLLKAHDINLIYEVKLPSQGLALTMLCRSAFGENTPPDDFRELAVKVAKLAGNLPLGLSVLGSSLRRREKDEWMDLLLELQNGLNGDIIKTLRVSYDRLHEKDQDMFLYIACLFNGFEVSYVNNLLKDNARLTTLANKSLIRITPEGYIEMHNLLEKLGIEIDRAKSNGNLGKRRFLTDFEDIEEVLTEKTGTETVLGIRLESDFWKKRLLSIDEKAFEGMHNLQYLSVRFGYDITLPRGFVSLPHKLRLLEWDYFPLQCLPSTFKAKYLVELKMMYSQLEKLWEGTQPLGSLKKMNLWFSKYLKEIPDLSNAINLEELDLRGCSSLVILPSSIQNAIKLRKLDCSNELLIDIKSLEGMRNLQYLSVDGRPNMDLPHGLIYFPHKLRLLEWDYFPLKCLPSNFKVEYLVELRMKYSKLEKLWEENQPLGSLKKMILYASYNLKEIPDLSNAINLEELDLARCSSLVTLPSSIQNAIKLRKLDMRRCTKLESFPTHLNLESLQYLDLTECDNLRNFPAIKMGNPDFRRFKRIEIVVENCFWNKYLPGLDYLDCLKTCMPCKFRPEYLVRLDVRGNKLEKLWEGVQSLGSLEEMDLSECENLTEIPDLSKATNLERFYLSGCKSLVTLPSTIENLQNLRCLYMKGCTMLEVLPTDVNLSSLDILDLSGCSSLRSFPLISTRMECLYLENTAIVEVPCCIEKFSRLTVLMMYCCQSLKNISPNIFRLTSLILVDFTDCRGVIMALSDATVVATMEDHISCVPLHENIEYTCERFWDEFYDDDSDDDYLEVDWDLDREYFSFRNCFELERDARELILRSCFKPVALPGGEIPKYFQLQHRDSGDSLTVTLPQSSLSQYFLRFKACVVVDPLSEGKGWYPSLEVNVGFNGAQYQKSFFEEAELQFCKTDHLFFCSFKFDPEDLPSKSTLNDVEFKFCCSNRIKECGVQLLNVYPSPDGSDGSSETEYNQRSGEKCDVVAMLMRMTSGTSSEEYINLARDQIVADTGLAALNLEVPLGQGEASAVSSYPSLEGEALCVDYMITEEQAEQIPILDPVSDVKIFRRIKLL